MDIADISFVDDDVKTKPKRVTKKRKSETIVIKQKKVAKKKKTVEKISELRTVVRTVKGIKKIITIGGKKTKAKTKKQKKHIDFRQFDITTKTSFLKVEEQYIIFSPYGKDAKADIIGVDIGEIHLAITGIRRRKGKRPLVVWFSLFSLPSKASHFVIDKITEILWKNENFGWVREASRHRIELQFQRNTKAQIMAGGIRACFESLVYAQGRQPNVEYIHADKKYDIAPKYSEEARQDPIRQLNISGAKGGKKRKELGDNDCKALLRLNENDDKKALRFIDIFEDYADQLHDIADSYLIACAGDEEITQEEAKQEAKQIKLQMKQKTQNRKRKSDEPTAQSKKRKVEE